MGIEIYEDKGVQRISGEVQGKKVTGGVSTCGLGTHLFVKDLDQEIAKGPYRSSSQAATCYYSLTTQR